VNHPRAPGVGHPEAPAARRGATTGGGHIDPGALARLLDQLITTAQELADELTERVAEYHQFRGVMRLQLSSHSAAVRSFEFIPERATRISNQLKGIASKLIRLQQTTLQMRGRQAFDDSHGAGVNMITRVHMLPRRLDDEAGAVIAETASMLVKIRGQLEVKQREAGEIKACLSRAHATSRKFMRAQSSSISAA